MIKIKTLLAVVFITMFEDFSIFNLVNFLSHRLKMRKAFDKQEVGCRGIVIKFIII